jgi:hypothetical protein
MHRSGTSALAGVLSRCGFASPRHLLAPREGNERGFFEAETFNVINTAILSDLGQSWYTLAPLDDASFRSPALARKRDHISSLIANEYPGSAPPLIKDPRICRLFPVWDDELEKVAKQLFLPVIIRPAIEVARSLEHRNQFDTEFGLLLWARYHLDLERHTRGRLRRFISFEELMDNWRGAVGKLNLPVDPAAIDDNWIEDFLARDLRHHHAEPAATDRYPLVAEVEAILSGWTTSGRDRPADFPRLDALRAKLDDMAPIVDDLFNKGRLERKRRIGVVAEASAVSAELRRARQSLEDRQDLKDRLSQAEAERHAAEARRRDAEANLNRIRGRLEVANESRQLLEDRLHKSLTQHERLLSRASAVKADLDLVKQKYRGTQMSLERERAKVLRLREGNATLNDALARLKQGWGYRLEDRLRSFATRSAKVFRVGRGRRANQREQLRTIRESNLFDEAYYVEQNSDIAAANIDPAQHFLNLGWREGRSPSAAFSTTRYLKRHADVAALAVNPLLHYLEHGRFEGREYFGTGLAPAVVPKPDAKKSPPKASAAPVFRGVRAQSAKGKWRRACHLRATEQAIVVDGLGLGLGSATVSRAVVESALAEFTILCGEPGDIAGETCSAGHLPDLVDAYFRTSRRLVTRWAGTEASVLRAVQLQPASGLLTIVGEGYASSPLDLIEFDLVAPMLPLMLVATSPDGEIQGLACIAFPSLFRGGRHYVEALGNGADYDSVDPVVFSATLERSLRALRADKAGPLVKAIKVDLGGADASTPLFQRDMRDMLDRIFGIALTPEATGAADARLDFIASAVTLKPRRARLTGATLTLSADMVPSLTVLVAAAEGSAAMRDLAMPLALVEPDPSQPAICFVPPPIKGAIPALRSPSHKLPFPRLRGRFTTAPMAAIRTLVRPLEDAELLVPDMALAPGCAAEARTIDWLIAPREWDDKLLARALAALKLQQGVAGQSILFIGEAGAEASEAAKLLFGAAFRTVASRDEALNLAEAPLVGYLGGGLVLHDARTAAVLATLAITPSTISASCVLVRSEKRGKVWKTIAVDGGKMPFDKLLVHGPMAPSSVEMLWRATYPVATPPQGLWLSRRENVRGWHDGGWVQKGFHFLTSLISASYISEGNVGEGEVVIATLPATDHWALQAKVLAG